MKVDVFKKIVKETVKEVIQEELKEILLEALKSNMGNKLHDSSPWGVDRKLVSPPQKLDSTINTGVNLREKYNQALNETVLNFTSQDVPKFQPTPSTDPINGQLPGGDVDLSQIMGLLNT